MFHSFFKTLKLFYTEYFVYDNYTEYNFKTDKITRFQENGLNLIDKKMKRKIMTAIHLIHLIKYVTLDENELRDHLRLLKSESVEDDSSEHSQSISSNT